MDVELETKVGLSYFLSHLDDTTTPRDDDDDDDDNGYNWPSVTCWAMNWATHAPPAPPLPLTCHVTRQNTTQGTAEAWGMGVLHPFPNKVRSFLEK